MTPGSLLQGRYQVLALIGEGSMGSVYRGERLGLSRPAPGRKRARQLLRDWNRRPLFRW